MNIQVQYTNGHKAGIQEELEVPDDTKLIIGAVLVDNVAIDKTAYYLAGTSFDVYLLRAV